MKIVPLAFLAFLFIPAIALAQVKSDAHARFDQLQRALAGDRAAITQITEVDEDRAFFHFVRATALARINQLDEAAAAFQNAIRLGDDLAILALAEMLRDAGRHMDAYAWAQVWVQSHFTLAEIYEGKANRDPGMAILRETLSELDEAAIAQAELHAGQVLNDWLPKFENQPTSCIQPSLICPSWSVAHRRRPVFPSQMGMRGEEGWTRHALLIDEQGQVAEVLTVHSTHAQARRSAERALRRWRFESSAEQPEPTIFQQTVLFRMR